MDGLGEVEQAFAFALRSSSTSRRISALKSARERLVDKNFSGNPQALLPAVFATYPLYIDRPSRREAYSCLKALLERDPSCLSECVKRLSNESSKAGLAASSALVLIEWIALALQTCIKDSISWKASWEALIPADAVLLDLVCGSETRKNLVQAACRVTKRSLRTIFARSDVGKDSAELTVGLLTKKGSLGYRATILLGLIARAFKDNTENASAPAKPVTSTQSNALDKCRSLFISFWVREVIGSKSIVPGYVASAFKDFFLHYTTLEDVQSELAPALEKSLLRAPEVALNGLIPPMFASMSQSFDLSETLSTHLMKPLLANAKSPNRTQRSGALSAYQVILPRCRDNTILEDVVNETLAPLVNGKLSSSDQKVSFSVILEFVPPSESRSLSIAHGIAGIVLKEPNEAVGAAELQALTKHALSLLQRSHEDMKFILNTYPKGLGDKKPAFRRLWASSAGDLLWGARDSPQAEFAHSLDSLLPKLVDQFNEVNGNPIQAAQSGLIVAAYVLLSLFQSTQGVAVETSTSTLLKRTSALDVALASEGTSSFLLNPKYYTKLSSEHDFKWLTRALAACSAKVAALDPSSEPAHAWSQALIYAAVGDSVPHRARRETILTISQLYQGNRRAVSQILIEGIWIWFRHRAVENRDSAAVAARSGMRDIARILRAICPQASNPTEREGSESTSQVEEQLIGLLVLCQPQVVPHISWIDLCLRMGQDPGDLATHHGQKCVDKVNNVLDTDGDNSPPLNAIQIAGYKSFAELAFVAPNACTSLLVGQITRELAMSQIAEFTPTDYAIARTAEGTAFVDVLSRKSAPETLSKGSSDYDILKWEADVRAQVAAKQGSAKKLSADEQAKVAAQLNKEKEIRSRVFRSQSHVLRGFGIVHGLATGPPTEASVWMGPALHCLISLVKAGVGLLVNEAAEETYIACSNLIATRLGLLRPFIGVATLRALGSAHVPLAMCEEPLGNLVTRLLYRLRLAGEQIPFDTVSLVYIIPLLAVVLDQVGVGVKEDSADEQVTLALEFLALHADSFSDEALPRGQVLHTLIRSMQAFTQHYKIIKDCLSVTCRAVSENMTAEEIKILLKGAIVPEASVRAAVLLTIREFVDLTSLDFVKEVWLACHDDEQGNAATADLIWQENALEANHQDAFKILSYLQSLDLSLRRAAARSIAACVSGNSTTFTGILEDLKGHYRELEKPRMPERDAYGILKKTDLRDPWEGRHGVALAFKELAPAWKEPELLPSIKFLITSGALGDRNATVREAMIKSATTIIKIHGKAKIEELMATFEATIAPSAKDEGYSDQVNEAIVILYGALARHLSPGDKRIANVLDRLLEALATPSESVQYAVANCLPPLIRNIPKKTSDYVQKAVDQTLTSRHYAARRGAAYGLAGLVNGRGITALREYRIMATLKSAIENKKEVNHRQGALFAYELFSLILGKVFEPYVIQIVPQLITAFGDANADVREACLDAAKTCFSSLSSYGVKVILPMLLDGLDETQWRSKKGVCDLLGAMAYLDPQQLALSLPDIIPPLTGVLNDSHKEVRASANRSLQRFGEVISNPEVKSLVQVLLKALSDPTKHTDDALDALIKVSFVHYLDAPSLALVARILERGLGDRSGTKRKAAQIIGSLAHLTERKDLVSHLPILVEGLRAAIVDPVPATRATSSKALGSLVEKLGEDALPDLIPSLMATLKSEAGAGDRLGSAQALSEVLAGLGTSRLEETLPTILQNATSNRPSVREGFMSLFIFLPACFGNGFASYLSKIIPPILNGLADELEAIRETALRAGRLLVKNFATKSIDLLLPELDRGLADDNYRIRLSSVELVGDLLFNLTGVSMKDDEEHDEERAKETSQSLMEVLGEEKRNKVLSSLYICRCDTSGLVRSAAINVWKVLVSSPRTLKELVPTLSQTLIKRLASPNPEQRVIAGNALGELIRKAGDSILSTLLPTLNEELDKSTDSDSKQGICIALREVISSASPEALEEYEDLLIAVVRSALADSDNEVRETAAEAFDSLQQVLGKKAVDRVLPHLLSLLRIEGEADQALSALLTLLTDNTRSNIILPNLIPTLLTKPITGFDARAVASLSKVAGSSINRRLPTILTALMDNIVTCKDDDLRRELQVSFDTVLASADEHDGLNTIMSVMLSLVKHDDHRRRSEAATRLGIFFGASEVDFSRYYPDIVRVLLLSYDDRDMEVVRAACAALMDLMKCLSREDMDSLVVPTRQVVQQVGVPGHNLPGFSLPKGINSILPIFLQSLMYSSAEQRTQAALALSDIIDRTSSDALKPYVTNITGPLIRVVSEKSVDLKCAILLTLNNLLDKIPLLLKPFLPQLQRTFARLLADTSSDLLRSRAAKALGTLLNLKPRVDPLIAELVTGTRTPDTGVRNAMLKALYEVVSKAGENMNESSRNAILGLIDSEPTEADESMAVTNARLLGALIKVLPSTDAHSLIKHRALSSRPTQPSVLNLNSLFVEAPGALLDAFAEDVINLVARGISLQQTFLADNFVLAGGKYLLYDRAHSESEDLTPIIEALASIINPGHSVDTRRLALIVIRTVSRTKPAAVRPHLGLLIPPVFASVRDVVIPVKLAAEAAFLSLFDVIESESAVFEGYLAGPGAELSPTVKKSMQDYFKRVALRLAAQAKERREAEGGQGGLGLSNDEAEDEKEIWSVGKMEIGNVFSQDG